MMRISPVGYMFDYEAEVIENARLATMPSHNSREAIDSATIVALIIYFSRKNTVYIPNQKDNLYLIKYDIN